MSTEMHSWFGLFGLSPVTILDDYFPISYLSIFIRAPATHRSIAQGFMPPFLNSFPINLFQNVQMHAHRKV